WLGSRNLRRANSAAFELREGRRAIRGPCRNGGHHRRDPAAGGGARGHLGSGLSLALYLSISGERSARQGRIAAAARRALARKRPSRTTYKVMPKPARATPACGRPRAPHCWKWCITDDKNEHSNHWEITIT